MSVKVENVSSCKIKLSFTVDAKVFEEALDKAFEEKKKTVTVDGFRPGHITRDIYNRKFGEESLYELAIDNIVNDEYIKAIQSKKLEVIGRPELDVDFETVGKGKKLKFTITTEIWPEVTLGQYKGIEATKEKVEVKDEDINEKIERTLKNSAELVVVDDGKIESGDTAVFDFEGFCDGVAFEGGSAKNYSLEIGSGQFIPGFEDQMIGMAKDEAKDINVKFPESYHAENLKGKDATFKILVHEIKKRVLPELSDEFVKDLNLEGINTVEEYKESVRKELIADRQEASDNKLVEDIFMAAMDNATVEIPETLVNEEIERNLKQIESQAKMYNVSVETFLSICGLGDVENYKEQSKPNAILTVKQRMVFSEIAKVEKLKVSDADYKKELEKAAKEMGKKVEEISKVYTKDAITPYILIQKAMDLVRKEAIVK